MFNFLFGLILALYSISPVYAQDEQPTVYKIQIEKSQEAPAVKDEAEELEEIRFMPVDRQKYEFKNISNPNDKYEYRTTSFDTENFNGKFDFNLADEENQHIEYAELNFQKELFPNLKFNSDIFIRDAFSNYDDVQFDSNIYFSTDITDNHSLYFGQSRLSGSNGRTLSFMQMAEDTYGGDDVGVKLDADYEKFDYSFGVYDDLSDSSSGRKSLGGTAAFKNFLPDDSLGSLSFGGGVYSSNDTQVENNTYGLFSEYNVDRFTLKGEFARNMQESSIGDIGQAERNTWGLKNNFKVTDNLTFFAGHNQKVEQLWRKNDIGLEYNAPKLKYVDLENVKFEINASYINDDMQKESSRRFGIFTKYSF